MKQTRYHRMVISQKFRQLKLFFFNIVYFFNARAILLCPHNIISLVKKKSTTFGKILPRRVPLKNYQRNRNINIFIKPTPRRKLKMLNATCWTTKNNSKFLHLRHAYCVLEMRLIDEKSHANMRNE